jgi:hypothetical protein
MDVEAELPLLQFSCKPDRAGSRGRRARENRRRSPQDQPLDRYPVTLPRTRGRDPLRRRSCSEATALTAGKVRASSARDRPNRLFALLWLIWRAAHWRDGPHAPRIVGETVRSLSAHSSRSESNRVGPLLLALTRSPRRRRMTGICGFCSLMVQGGEALPVIDALGCLCSLRARWRLMG